MQRARRRLILAAALGVAVIGLAAGSDFVIGSFWSRHAMVTSLSASLIVLAVTVAVLNEWLDRRDRRRWSVLAQYVLFQLVQTARLTWTTLFELLDGEEIAVARTEDLVAAARRALDTAAVSAAARALLADDSRRDLLRQIISELATHSQAVIARWAAVMVGSGPYTDLFNRHVELQGRLDWLGEILAQGRPAEDRSIRDEKLARSSVATEHSELFGSQEWLHDQLVATVQLALRLDYRSRTVAFEIVPMEWWRTRTLEAVGDLAALEQWPTSTAP